MEVLDDPSLPIEKKQSMINKLKIEKNTKALITALKAYDWRVRVVAVNALNDLGDKMAINPLVETLKDAYPFVRLRTTVALDNLGWEPTNALETVYYLIAKEKWIEAEKMGKVAIEPLIDAALAFNNTKSTETIAKPLGRIGEPAVERVVNRLTGIIVKKKAIGMDAFWLSIILKTIGNDAIGPLVKALDNENRFVRLKLLETIGHIGDKNVAEFVVPLLKDEDMQVRAAALKLLEQIKPNAIPSKEEKNEKESQEVKAQEEDKVLSLIASLEDQKGSVRREAAIKLGEIRDLRAIKPLIETLNKAEKDFLADRSFDFNMDFMKILSVALGKMGKPAIKPLVMALKNINTSEALINIGHLATDALILALQNENETVRQRASYALGEIKDIKAVEPLIKCLQDVQVGVRRTAVSALGQIGDPKAVEQLTKSLENEDTDVRQFAAAALGMIGDPRSVKKLIKRLKKDPKWVVRSNAAMALGMIGGNKAIRSLIKSKKKDKDKSVCDAAERALQEINLKASDS